MPDLNPTIRGCVFGKSGVNVPLKSLDSKSYEACLTGQFRIHVGDPRGTVRGAYAYRDQLTFGRDQTVDRTVSHYGKMTHFIN